MYIVPLDYGSYQGRELTADEATHGDIPRYMVSDARAEAKITEILTTYGLKPRFGGDPRGYVVSVMLPDGKHNTWGGAECGWGIA